MNAGICKDIVQSLIAFAHPLHPSVAFAHFESEPFYNFRTEGAYNIESSLDLAAINIYGTVMITVQRFSKGNNSSLLCIHRNIQLRTAKKSWANSARSRS